MFSRQHGKIGALFGAMFLLGLSAPLALAADADEPIDWNRARQLFQKRKRGQQLTSEERAYLNRARKQRRSQRGQKNQPVPEVAGDVLVMEHFLELSAPSRTGAENVAGEPAPNHQVAADTGQPHSVGALKPTLPGLQADRLLQSRDRAFPGD